MRARFLILLSAGWMIAGCSPSIVRSSLDPIDPELLQLCAPLTRLASGRHQAVEEWAVATVFSYKECSDRHRALVETVKLRQSIEEKLGAGDVGPAR